MALEYGTFAQGGVVYPLTSSLANPLLADADPSLYALLHFAQAMLEHYLGDRFTAAANAIALKDARGNVNEVLVGTMPFPPAPFLSSQQVKLPLLAAYRVDEDLTVEKSYHQAVRSLCRIDIDYVLPPFDAAQAEAMWPMLKAVGDVLKNRFEAGFDPSYTPPFQGAQQGDSLWQFSGIEEFRLLRGRFGSWTMTEGLSFPSYHLEVEFRESNSTPAGAFDELEATEAHIDLTPSDGEDPVEDFIVLLNDQLAP